MTTTTAVSTTRRHRAALVGTAVVATGAIYLAASAAGTDFRLTDPHGAQAHHLILPEIAFFTLFFAVLGWGTLALLEKVTRHAKAAWATLAVAVLLLSFVPIALETATTGTKAMLSLIHLAVAAAVVPMLRRR